jgi:hypothetical protein
MALSDIEKEKDKARPNRAIDAGTNLRWSDQQKVDAAKSWLVLGNTSMVARLHGIPRITLCKWQETGWWHELIQELKLQERIVLSSKMKALVDAAHQVVANRLDQGDAVLTPKGEIVYKPVSMKDAHRVAVDLVNQRQVLEKADKMMPVVEGASEKLEALAEKFAALATQKIEHKLDKNRTIDITDVTEKHNVEVVSRGSASGEILSSDPHGVQTVDEGTQETSS